MPVYESIKNADNKIVISAKNRDSVTFGWDKVVDKIASLVDVAGKNIAIDGWYGIDFEKIAKAVSECAGMLPEAFPADGGKSVFAETYNKNVIKFRNKLAHVKQLNAQNPVLIGEVNGVEYKCDAPFCAMIRETLIQYGNWFDSLNERLAESE